MSGPLALVGGAAGATGALPRLPRRRRVPSWAAGDPVAELAERLSDVCAAAVHPDEIAAALESEGLTDEQITGHYGHPDLFSLAEELFRVVARRFPEPEPSDDPWRAEVWPCLLRGLTFALPGAAYVLGGRWADGPDGPFGVSRTVAAWGAATLCGWAWNQALSHRARLHLLAHRPRAAARCLLTGGTAGAFLATACAAAVSGLTGLPALAFAAGQSLYVAAATVLLVLDRARSLLYVLTPLAVAVCCGAGGLPSAAVAVLLAATVGAAILSAVAAALRTAADGQAGAPAGRAARTVRTVRLALSARRTAADGAAAERRPSPYASLPHGLAGLAAGWLVIVAALAGEFVAALTVSMGMAEWLLFRFRSRCLSVLRRIAAHERLLARSWRVLAGCLAAYGATLAGLAAVEAATVPGAAPWDTAHLAVLLALGATLWLAQLLESCGRVWTGTCVLGAAAGAAAVLLGAHAAAPGTVLGLVCACAAAVLLAAATAVTGRVTTHR
ncbi:hypothetical protein [Streptomyces sp.]|uniref:hypothetical protein n=1 Tax=Streptomyces sp. TaxID=1931 RepID=UPI002F3F7ABE